MLKIFCDKDGLLYDWEQHALDTFGYSLTKDEKNRLKNNEIDVCHIIPKIMDDVSFHGGWEFWRDIPLFPWAKKLVEELKKKGTVAFLTSQGKFLDAPKGKMIASHNHFPDVPLIMTSDKWLCAGPNTLLIDDKPKNTRKFQEHGGRTILFPTKYLVEEKGERIIWDLIDSI